MAGDQLQVQVCREGAAFERTERGENNQLELPHKTLARQGANQFTHFQREQHAG